MRKDKTQKNNGHYALNSSKGFALLFAVTLAAILLSVALGVTSVVMKEVSFSTSAKDTNDAFFAADSGAEYVLYNDRSNFNNYPAPTVPPDPNTNSWNILVTGLNSNLQGCAKITIAKTVTASTASTSIISQGHNNGSPTCSSNSSTVERQLEINY